MSKSLAKNAKKRVAKGKEAYDLKDEPCETCPDPEEPMTVQETATTRYIPEYPIRIAVVGAPGSGKSDFIKAFVKKSKPLFSTAGQPPLKVVSNPGLDIEKLNQAMGIFGGFREHLWTFFKRFDQEFAANFEGKSFISSGTVLESMAHAAVNYENIMLGLGDNSSIVTAKTQMYMEQLGLAMTVLGHLYRENFGHYYHFGWYLPLAETKIIIPGQEVEQSVEERHAFRVDAALQQLFANFSIPLQVLDQPTAKEKAEVAFAAVNEIMTEGVDIPIPVQQELLDEIKMAPEAVDDSPSESATLPE